MIGRTISHYKILEKLGEGGMGVVYKAEDTKLRRTVALRFLPPAILAGESDRIRFVHEAQASGARASAFRPAQCGRVAPGTLQARIFHLLQFGLVGEPL